MRVLLDHCVDVRFAKLLDSHDVHHTKAMGWEGLNNGNLLRTAEEAGFVALITVDKNVRFQQKISKRRISLITLNPRFVDLEYITPMATQLLSKLKSGFPEGSDIVLEP